MEIILIVIVGGAALAAVFYPLLRPDATSADMDAATEPDPMAADVATEATLAADIERYRAAVRAGTVCARCRQANPPGSRFCYECGKPVSADQPRPGEGDMD